MVISPEKTNSLTLSGWCDCNSVVIIPEKTNSVTIATRQKPQPLPSPFSFLQRGVHIEQVAHIQSAVCNHVVSKSLPVKHGAPQGSVLGPGLFDFNACDYSTQADHTQLVGMATDNKRRCDQHTDIMCKTRSKQVFPLRYIVYTFTLKTLLQCPH